MKVKLRVDDECVGVRIVDGRAIVAQCPSCKATGAEVRGQGIERHDHDTYYAQALCLSCGERIGTLETTVSTIFGIEEDRAVLQGRARVY